MLLKPGCEEEERAVRQAASSRVVEEASVSFKRAVPVLQLCCSAFREAAAAFTVLSVQGPIPQARRMNRSAFL
jgi:hypothetical protein